MTYFNPRTHMGCDCPHHFASISIRGISIHAPTWGATVYGFQAKLTITISIHAPTWGATDAVRVVVVRAIISIHAPTWGATFLLLFRSCNEGISIHAPTWGATSRPLQGSVAWWDFNPRTHMGCDGYHHMPCFHLLVHFNPRTHMGCDSLPDYRVLLYRAFQSTHPHGVRLFPNL